MIYILKITLLLPLVFVLSYCNSFGQKKNNYNSKIDSLIKVADPKFNGVILISKKGKTVYSKAQGFGDFDKKTPLSIDSQFEIMSNTRQITAVLILKEAEQGRIDLQAPIKKYLPELKQTWADTVTVHQLLNHTHGITDMKKPLLFKPGTDFKYGNMGYPLLGKIIEYSSKKSYSEMAALLFKNLKMNNTFCYSQDNNKNLVSGYINTNNSFEKAKNSLITPETVPSCGIISTINDLAIWNNSLHKGKLLQPETYQLMIQYTIKAQHNVFGEEKAGYGYGIRIADHGTQKYIGHTGLGDGFSSVNLYFPKSDVSFIAIENQMNTKPELLYNTEIKIKNILLESGLLN